MNVIEVHYVRLPNNKNIMLREKTNGRGERREKCVFPLMCSVYCDRKAQEDLLGGPGRVDQQEKQ